MRVLIADDEPVAREILRDLVQSIPDLELVGEAANGTEAVAAIFTHRPDLLLLDMQMPELQGLTLARSLTQEPRPLIIFVTAYEQYALDAFEIGAVDYLLKPVRRERFVNAIEKARRQYVRPVPALAEAAKPPTAPQNITPRRIAARRGSDIYLIALAEVIAFQAEGELVYLITATERYLSDESLKALEATLAPGGRFRRIHRSSIINTDHIRKVSPLSSNRWLLKMSNGLEVVVSKRLASSIRIQGQW